MTALVARVIAWADGRRLGRGAGTSVTAHGLGLSSGQSGEQGGDRNKRGDHHLASSQGFATGFYNKRLFTNSLGYSIQTEGDMGCSEPGALRRAPPPAIASFSCLFGGKKTGKYLRVGKTGTYLQVGKTRKYLGVPILLDPSLLLVLVLVIHNPTDALLQPQEGD